MNRYKPFFKFEELRKNPEMNPHIGAWDYVDKYKDDDDVYISFTEIDKIGINPQSKFNTPVGIYTYPLKQFYKLYLKPALNLDNIRNRDTVGQYAPFAGNAKYVNFIRCKDKSHFINDMYRDYGSDDYDRDIKILEEKYKNYFKCPSEITNNLSRYFEILARRYQQDDNYIIDVSEIHELIVNTFAPVADLPFSFLTTKLFLNIRDMLKNYSNNKSNLEFIIYEISQQGNYFEKFIKNAQKQAKDKNPVMMMWNITRLLADKLSNNAKQASTKWNLILSKDLGYSGFADKSGKGYIHPSEPMQAVFFNTRAFEVITRVENVPAKSKTSEKDIMVRKLMDIMMISDERKEDFEINLLFSKDKKRILRYKGNFRIEKINIKMMPYQIEEIEGSFYAVHSNLTSFTNFPIEITGDLYLSKLPYIDSLKGFPKYIYGDLLIDKDLLDIFGETQIRNKSNIKGDVIIYG